MSMSEENTMQAGNSGLSVASLVLGILSAVTFFIAFLSLPMGILAIIFGAVSLKKAGRGKAIAGIVTGAVGIVLTIASFFMIFVVLPSLQGAQRDNMRKDDMAVISSDITYFQSNNNGKPPTAADLSTSYLSQIIYIASEGEPTTRQAVYEVGVDCEGVSSSRSYALKIELEDGSVYCVD